MHGNVCKTAQAKALPGPFELREIAVKFIDNYALIYAFIVPGRITVTKIPAFAMWQLRERQDCHRYALRWANP